MKGIIIMMMIISNLLLLQGCVVEINEKPSPEIKTRFINYNNLYAYMSNIDFECYDDESNLITLDDDFYYFSIWDDDKIIKKTKTIIPDIYLEQTIYKKFKIDVEFPEKFKICYLNIYNGMDYSVTIDNLKYNANCNFLNNVLIIKNKEEFYNYQYSEIYLKIENCFLNN